MTFNLAVVLRESAEATPGKPVALSDGGRLTYAELDALSDRFAAGVADVGLTALPLFHVFGLSSILDIVVRFGCTTSLIPRFDPATLR